ncbi:MASE1 domain-containing protein [bacterium]|nr:MASE1 domain-containing protein [bacterium]
MRIRTHPLVYLICVGIVYFIAAKIGLSLALPKTVVSPVWPPAGVALGAILLFGFRICPAIAAGAFFANYTAGLPFNIAFSIACGNTLEAILGGYFILAFVDSKTSLNRPQSIFYFVLACMLSTIVGATIGSTSIYFKGFHYNIHYGYLWLTWWLGDLIGAVILAPLIFAWGQRSYWRWDRARFLEFLLVLTVLVAAAHVVFRGWFDLISQRTYLAIPFVVWASFRFGRRGASSACFLLSAVAIWYTKNGYGPFVSEDLNESLLSMQVFMGVITVMGLALGAAVTQSRLSVSLQSALYPISEITTSVKEMKDFYAAVHGVVGELMYAKNFYISLYDRDTQMFHVPYFVDEFETLSPVPAKLDNGLTAYVLRTGRPLLATPEVFKQLLEQNAIEDIGVPSVDWLGVPLKTGERCIGVIAVQSYTEEIRFGEREKDILVFVSQHAAAAIERKRSEETLRASEEQYRSFFEEDLTADYICNPDGQLVACNPAFARIFGFASVKEAVASNVSELYPDTQNHKKKQNLLHRFTSSFAPAALRRSMISN